jgi:hypothetical protein
LKKYFGLAILLFLSVCLSSCVESLSESTSSSATPSVVIYSPASNDTIKVGSTNINYAAADGSGGTGLDHVDFYLNGIYAQKGSISSDGTLPTITISVDSTMVGKKISYYLVVYNKQGKSKTSTTQSGIFVRDKGPAAPSNLIAGFTNSNTVTLLWDDNSGNEKGFELWRKDINSTGVIEYRLMKTLLENTRSTIDFVSSSGAYYYKIRAFNYTDKNKISTYLYSDFSNEADPYSSAGGSWNLRAESVTDPSIHIFWNDFVPSEQGFIIERTPSFSSGSSTMLLAPNTTEYVDKDVITNTSYSYRLAFFTTTFKSPFSNSISVSTYYTSVAAPSLLQFITPISSSESGFHLQWKEQSKETMDGTIVQRMQLLPFVDWQDVDGMPITDIAVDNYDDKKVTVGRAYQYRIRQYSTSGSFVFYTPWTLTPAATAK